MSPGQVFILTAQNRAVDDHLWVVLSDPAQDSERVVIVSITTHSAEKDQSCIIQKEEFGPLTNVSCVAYQFARTMSVTAFNQLLLAGRVEMRPSISSELLERIRQSAADSRDLEMKFADILIEQGLLDV